VKLQNSNKTKWNKRFNFSGDESTPAHDSPAHTSPQPFCVSDAGANPGPVPDDAADADVPVANYDDYQHPQKCSGLLFLLKSTSCSNIIKAFTIENNFLLMLLTIAS